jgi:hypothetical protein
MPPKRE